MTHLVVQSNQILTLCLAVLLWIIYQFLGPRWIREHRRARGWTQEQLAEIVGVEPRTIQRWEAGHSEPRAKHLAALLDTFHVEGGQNIEVPEALFFGPESSSVFIQRLGRCSRVSSHLKLNPGTWQGTP
jgi:DNA-binding XRE family transcriptional regulator